MRIVEPKSKAKVCVIWMHGLGAGPEDMLGLVRALGIDVPVKHICLEAPVRPVTCNQSMRMRAWYDVLGFQPSDREDREGIEASERDIFQVIEQELDAGFAASQIFLAGFSQGGAMALFTGLRSKYALGGLVSLSAYLPLSTQVVPRLPKKTPIFIGYGTLDRIVLPALTMYAVDFLRARQFEAVDVHEYFMDHAICFDEMCALAHWITSHVDVSKSMIEGSA